MYGGYYQPYWTDSDELEHYGILGMKWGIRRYQNKDGTLTEAGKKRYANDTPEQIERSERRKAKVVKAAKAGAIVASSVITSGLTYYGLTNTSAGKAVVAAGIRAISKLVDSTAGEELPKANERNWYPPYRSSVNDPQVSQSVTQAVGRTVTYKNGQENIRIVIGNIPVDSIPDYNQRKNR